MRDVTYCANYKDSPKCAVHELCERASYGGMKFGSFANLNAGLHERCETFIPKQQPIKQEKKRAKRNRNSNRRD